jgi:hypothetical protein
MEFMPLFWDQLKEKVSTLRMIKFIFITFHIVIPQLFNYSQTYNDKVVSILIKHHALKIYVEVEV